MTSDCLIKSIFYPWYDGLTLCQDSNRFHVAFFMYKPIGPSALNDSCHEVFFCHFTILGSLFLNRTLLGGVESVRSESGSFFSHFTKLVTRYLLNFVGWCGIAAKRVRHSSIWY